MNELPLAQHGHFYTKAPAPYEEGTVADLMCDDGFFPEVATQSILAFHQGQWQWRPPSAWCVPALFTLPHARHGHFTCDELPPYTEGALAHLTCDPGFETLGENYSTLIREYDHVRWDPPFLSCLESSSPTLPVAEHGHFFVHDPPPYRHGTVARLVCDVGYASMVSKAFLRHDEEGLLQWNPPVARCAPGLDTLPLAHHGQFQISVSVPPIPHHPGPYLPGSRSVLECEEGYSTPVPIVSELVQENGQLTWHPPFAQCERVLYDVPPADNGAFIADTPAPYPEGTVVRLKCQEGFGTRAPVQAVARLDGLYLKWEPSFGFCEPALATLPEARGGEFISDTPPPYVSGTEATLHCHDGYGTKKRIFSYALHENGQFQWNPSSAQCLPALKELPFSLHGVFISDTLSPYLEGDTATLTCDPGYTRRGGSETRVVLEGSGVTWKPRLECVSSLTLPLTRPQSNAPGKGETPHGERPSQTTPPTPRWKNVFGFGLLLVLLCLGMIGVFLFLKEEMR